jgi:hypothetical protein
MRYTLETATHRFEKGNITSNQITSHVYEDFTKKYNRLLFYIGVRFLEIPAYIELA